MARKQPKNLRQNINVSVSGMMELENIERGIDRVVPLFLSRAGKRFRLSLVAATPRRTGRMASQWRATVDPQARSLSLANAHPGAKAQDRGAYIKPKRRKVLRFNSGDGVVYTRGPVRLHARQFSRKGLRGRGRIMQEEFARATDEVARGSAF